MKKFGLLFIAVLFAMGLVAADSAPSMAKTTYVTIGTGGVTGVYYPTGGAIGKIVNQKRKEYGIRVTVESTGGSVFNVNAIEAGDLEFGVIQSDRQYQAINGKAEWDGKPVEKLRAVFTIHPETFFLVAASDAGINSYEDLKGKAVAVGNPGSGQRQNFIDILKVYGMKHEDFWPGRGSQGGRVAQHAPGRAHRRLHLHRGQPQRHDQGIHRRPQEGQVHRGGGRQARRPDQEVPLLRQGQDSGQPSTRWPRTRKTCPPSRSRPPSAPPRTSRTTWSTP